MDRTDHRRPTGLRRLPRALLVGCLALAAAACAAPTPAPSPALAPAPVGEAAATRRLTILHTNDHHGHAWPGKYRDCADVGGLAAQATLVRGVRADVEGQGGGLLVLMGGDLNTGVPESDMFAAKPDLEAMAMVGYDAMVCGNHEFDGTAERWETQLSVATFPLLCANVRRRSDGSVAGRTHLSLTVGGLRVAMIGVVTAEVVDAGMGGMWQKRYRLDDPIETAAALAERLRPDHDLVIGLVHLGVYVDGPRSLTGSLALARRTDAFDVIVDGHTHTLLSAPLRVGKTIVVQAGDSGAYMGRVDLGVRGGEIVEQDYRLIPVNAPAPGDDECPTGAARIPAAPDVAAVLETYRVQVADRLAEAVGAVHAALPGGGHVARRGETALGDLLADAIRWITGADVAVVNGGGIRAPLGPGTVTWGDLLRVCPFNDHVRVLTIRGALLQEALDRSARSDPDDGGFLQVSGLTFVIRRDHAEDVRVGDAPLDPDADYRLATTDYLAEGGDGYVALTRAADGLDTGFHYAEVLRRYIAHHGTVAPLVEGRIRRE